MNPEDMKEKLLEHSFRFDAYDKLFEQHAKELATLEKSMEKLTEKLDKVVNRLIIAMILVALLGENAVPFIMKFSGG